MNNLKGWHLLGESFVNVMLLAGESIYSYGLFVQPVETEFSLTREHALKATVAE